MKMMNYVYLWKLSYFNLRKNCVQSLWLINERIKDQKVLRKINSLPSDLLSNAIFFLERHQQQRFKYFETINLKNWGFIREVNLFYKKSLFLLENIYSFSRMGVN